MPGEGPAEAPAVHEVPPGLRTDQPPQDPRQQLLAWAIDLHGLGSGREDRQPRWMIVQWHRQAVNGGYFWCCQTPGRQTSVRILGWQALAQLDQQGEYLAATTERAEREVKHG